MLQDLSVRSCDDWDFANPAMTVIVRIVRSVKVSCRSVQSCDNWGLANRAMTGIVQIMRSLKGSCRSMQCCNDLGPCESCGHLRIL